MVEFRMPALGADMDAGTLVEWKVKPGDRVKKGDLVATVETVKGAIEVEVFADGVVEELLVKPGTTVPVNTPLARIAEAGDTGQVHAEVPPEAPHLAPQPQAAEPRPQRELLAAAAKNVPAPAPSAPLGHPQAEWSPATTASEPGELPPHAPHLRASPVARKMAQALGVDLSVVHGSGPGGAVLKADVEAAAHAVERPGARHGLEPTAMRKAIGAAMARSKREIPHYYLSTEVDLGHALRWMQAQNADRPVSERLLPAALLLKATALAAKEVPEVNGTFDGAFTPSEAVHLGVAIHLKGGGLVAPALRDAQSLPLVALMQKLADLVTRARVGGLTTSEMGGQTLTVTNLGDLGVSAVFPVIVPPQVAMVGFGRVQARPWVVADGAIGPRPIVVASLAADHRVSEGQRGARYLSALEELLQHPEVL